MVPASHGLISGLDLPILENVWTGAYVMQLGKKCSLELEQGIY
jgi:hypothetical protein